MKSRLLELRLRWLARLAGLAGLARLAGMAGLAGLAGLPGVAAQGWLGFVVRKAALLVSAGFAVLCWFCGGLCWSLPISLVCAGFVLVSAGFAVLCWCCAGLSPGLCRFRWLMVYYITILHGILYNNTTWYTI
jgi:hypothetical protein